jgi:hypothetical protein
MAKSSGRWLLARESRAFCTVGLATTKKRRGNSGKKIGQKDRGAMPRRRMKYFSAPAGENI